MVGFHLKLAKGMKERLVVVDEQLGFRSFWNCIGQVFLLKYLVEKYREKREMYVAFMDSEKVHDEVCIEELWKVLYKYAVEEYLVKGVNNLFEVKRKEGVERRKWRRREA